MANKTDRTHVLYRFYDRTGELLYVGITCNPPQRFKKHRDSKDWWTEITTISIENHDSREDLIYAEWRAIRLEHPSYNVEHNTARSLPCPVCGLSSYYRRDIDRFVHIDGSRNLDCWAAITTGRVEPRTYDPDELIAAVDDITCEWEQWTQGWHGR